jgi:YebC/PmpR family DNA-binding regulatory protein
MAGHSKWAQIKRKKAVTDSRRAQVWTRLLKEVTVAARLGGGDPDANARLRNAIQDARGANVPNDNIDRAVKRGTGELEGIELVEIAYEGYGVGGVAVLVETMTDNRNRTAAEIRHLFSRHGGSLGENGCVAWMFTKRGYFAIDKGAMSEEEVMELALEVGADDVSIEDEVYEIHTEPSDYDSVREELERREIPLEGKELAMIPQNTVEVAGEDAARILRLMEALEEQDDVQKVWANFDLDPESLEGIEG